MNTAVVNLLLVQSVGPPCPDEQDKVDDGDYADDDDADRVLPDRCELEQLLSDI